MKRAVHKIQKGGISISFIILPPLFTNSVVRYDDEEDDDDDEDEVFCDIDNDPNVLRKVFELEGQEMEEDEEDMQDSAQMDDASGAGLGLKPTGFSEGRDEEVFQILRFTDQKSR